MLGLLLHGTRQYTEKCARSWVLFGKFLGAISRAMSQSRGVLNIRFNQDQGVVSLYDLEYHNFSVCCFQASEFFLCPVS